MLFRSFRKPANAKTKATSKREGKVSRQRLSCFKPWLEYLEDRTLLSMVTWIGGSGDWNTASNWSGGALPGNSDDVIINTSGITVTHSSGSHSINSLNLTSATSNNFVLSGGTLAVATSVQDNGTFSVSGGTLAGATVAAGTVIVGQTGSLSGVTLGGTLDMASVNGSLNIVNGMTVNGTVNLGSSTGTTSSSLSFPSTETLGGTGTVVFGGSVNSNPLIVSGTLTLGPGLTLRGSRQGELI
jgi:hypothetical protein